MMQGYEFDKAGYVGVLEAAYGERDSTSRAVYEKTLRLPFEDIEVNVAAGYQEYLDHLYGTDWMQLPEESKRTSNHMMQAYWM
jgi:phosphorylcholine metabolism protein LicD